MNQAAMLKFYWEKNATVKATQELYKETLSDSCSSCDLIIKSGEKLEHFCHRVVLASVSDFLRDALRTAEPGTIPVIILPDTTSEVLKLVLSYAYNGEVLVQQEVYTAFFITCRLLRLKMPLGGVKVAGEEQTKDYEVSVLPTETESELIAMPEEEEVEVKEEPIEMIEVSGDEEEMTEDPLDSLDFEEPAEAMEEDVVIENEPVDENYEEETVEDDVGPSTSGVDPGIDDEQRAKVCVRGVYDRINEKLGDKLDEVVNNTKILYKDGKLLGARHQCGFCKTFITLYAINNVSWNNFNLRKHMVDKHKFTYTLSIQHRHDFLS